MKSTIAIFVHESSLSGANVALLEMIQVIVTRYEIVLICPTYGSIINAVLKIDDDIIVIVKEYKWWMENGSSGKLKSLINSKIRNIIAIHDLSLLLQKHNVEFIISNTAVINIGARISKIFGVRHFWIIHEFGMLDHGLRYIMGNSAAKFFMNNYGGKIIANSKAVSSFYSRFLGRGIPVLYQPVVIPDISIDSKFDNSEFKFVIYGRICAKKGQLFAIECMLGILKQGIVNFKLTIMGNPENLDYLNFITKYINDHSLQEFVTIMNHQENPFNEVMRHNVVLNFSENEAFGRTNIEAMKLGRLLIAADRGSSSELIINGINGFIVKYGDVDSFVDLINSLRELPSVELNNILEAAYDYASMTFNKSEYSKNLNELLN